MASVTFSGPLFDTPDLARRITEAFLREMGSRIESGLVPRLVQRIPIDTGALQRSLRIEAAPRSGYVRIYFADPGRRYYRYQGRMIQDFRDLWTKFLRAEIPGAYRRAIQEVLRA